LGHGISPVGLITIFLNPIRVKRTSDDMHDHCHTSNRRTQATPCGCNARRVLCITPLVWLGILAGGGSKMEGKLHRSFSDSVSKA